MAADTLVLGTAGHIDHGKTSLVRALTGVDTDRLPEEKARGITIELGFAPLVLPSGRTLGVVDVPGHEALVRTMVAGASGIDLVLLVVAADEGVMPQTREHLAICRLLGLAHGVVALTKCDLAEPDVADLAEAEVAELLRGTALAAAPVVRVSSTTGAGLDALRAALDAAVEKSEARTPRAGAPRLWIDRAFEMRGFGGVVTGTLTGGALSVGDTVELLPSGRRARVRGLQRFGKSAERVAPGARCAINLQGVALAELSRGELVTTPGALAATGSFDAELDWLASAPPLGPKPAAAELLVGTAARRAHVAPIGAEHIEPGARGLARVHLDDGALPLAPGDRFVVRGFARGAEGATLGGGRVVDPAPPRRRRSDAALADEVARLAAADAREAVALRVARGGLAGAERGALAQSTALAPAALGEALAALEESGAVVRCGERWLSREAVHEIERRVGAALAAFHESQPMRPGMPRGALRGALPENVERASFEVSLARLVARGAVEAADDLVRARDFVPRLTQRQEAIAAQLRADAMRSGLEPPTLRDWLAELGAGEEELRDVLAHLERDGSLTRAPGDLWFDRFAVDELRAKVVAHLEAHGRLDTAAYKDLIGTSRKYAVPLMELFDAEHLTVRRGEARVLRRRSG